MDQMAPTVLEDQRFILSALPPSPGQRRLALTIVLVLILAFLITIGPLSTLRPRRVNAFVSTYATALFVTDMITMVLLFAQFSIVRSRALAVLATGYLLAALIMIPWMLTFPGVFAPDGLLGAGLYTAQWLYNLRPLSFPMFVIAYALLKDAEPMRRSWQGSVAPVVFSSAALAVALVSAATLLATAGHDLLPHTMRDPVHFAPLRFYIAGCQIGLSAAALIVLWVRLRSVLDLWLMVVMCAYIIEPCVTVFPVPARFSAGWYAGPVYGLVSGSVLLFALLYEITALYGQLLGAILAQRREREARLMTGDAIAAAMAHEVKQPLSAMITSADAATHWLDRSMPEIDKAKVSLTRIAASGHRAGAVIESIRAMFMSSARSRTSFDINETINETIKMQRGDLLEHRISVQTDTSRQARPVTGNRTQLQQVLLNLIANAIDAMASADEPRTLSVKSEVLDSGVMVAVADSGKGIAPQDMELIFNPLFTTKSNGMGMGLSICRSIIEAHDGQLWVSQNTPRGAVFRFVLPAAAA